MIKKSDNKKVANSKTNQIYDLIIVGGGVAGVDIALEAAKNNYKTALIEPNKMGGVCLNTGCIPTKTILRSSELYSEIKNAGEFGLSVKNVDFDFGKIMQRARDIVAQTQKGIQLNLNNKNITVFTTYASFVDEKKVKVGDKVIEGKKIIIATGSKPHIPSISGLQDVDYTLSGAQKESKEEILNIKSVPKTLVIIGGGYIGFEYATFFSELGSKIIILEATNRVLNSVDDEILEVVMKKYLTDRFSVVTGANITKVEEAKGQKKVYYSDSKGNTKSVSGEALLIATGRVPSTFELHLERTNVKKDERGAIAVNEEFETSCEGIYAVGDVTGKAMFAHTAKKEGKIALQNAFNSKGIKMGFNAIPWVTFTNPPIAGVGVTENKESIGTMKAFFSRAARSGIMGNSNGLLKVWYDKKTEKILGAQIFGLNSDDLIGEFTALINCNATLKEMRNTIHVHPTLSEVTNFLVEKKD